ncbi:MAG: hypothetical protein LBP33_04980 [Candidatus Adiutrix sp.]|nr:hypothetical protein [Candidatus Adiutrix sp.]
MSEDKKTGFLVEGEWENSYLEIMFGSAVQLNGSSLEIAGAKGDLTGAFMAEFSLALTMGAFLSSNSLTICYTKQLRTAVEETTASKVETAISDVGVLVERSSVSGNELKAGISALQSRVDNAIAAADTAKAELSRLAAAARRNETFLNALGIRGDGTSLTGVDNEALASGQRAAGNLDQLTANDMRMGAVNIGAAGDLAISRAQSNRCAALTTELTALTTNV